MKADEQEEPQTAKMAVCATHCSAYPPVDAELEFAVRVFSVAVGSTVGYSTGVSKLRRPFLSNRYFFTTVRLLERRTKVTESDFVLLTRALNRARTLHPVYLTAWVFLPDHNMNPVRAGLVSRPEDWRWSSFNEYAGATSDEQKQRCGLVIDRVRMPSDPRARI